jgi:hypothetical protein
MQVKKLKFRQACLIGAFIFFSIAAQGQSFLHPGVTFDLSFAAGSNVLEVTYDNNRLEISGLNEFISYNRTSIQRGSSHLAIIAYIKQEQKENLYAVNRASVLGSVVRSYLKTRHGLNNLQFTFIIRTDESVTNLVRVEYRPYSVKPYDNQEIFYTLKPTYKELIYAMANYSEIPYETDKRQKLMEGFPEENNDYETKESVRVEELLSRISELEKKFTQTAKVNGQAQQVNENFSNVNLQPVIVNTQPEKVYSQQTTSNTQPEKTYSQQAATYTQPERVYSQQSTANIQAENVYSHPQQTTSPQVATNLQPVNVNSQPQTIEKQSEKQVYKPIVAIKTNLLGIAGIIPPATFTDPIFNLSVEFFYAKRFSISAEGFKAPIVDKTDINSQDWYKVSGAVIENRVYLGKKESFNGFYAGLYGLYGDFDIRDVSVDEKGKTGSFAGGGLSIGYSLPLFRGLTLEAGLRAGYRSDKYDTYIVNNGSFFVSESLESSEFGLTSYNLSISYRFGGYKRSGIR